MKGCACVYPRLGRLLKQGRERQGLSLKEGALMLGLTNDHYLWRCEDGRWANFPASRLKRALELYQIPVSEAVFAISEDYKESMLRFLGGK